MAVFSIIGVLVLLAIGYAVGSIWPNSFIINVFNKVKGK
jgi:hypothetical protein